MNAINRGPHIPRGTPSGNSAQVTFRIRRQRCAAGVRSPPARYRERRRPDDGSDRPAGVAAAFYRIRRGDTCRGSDPSSPSPSRAATAFASSPCAPVGLRDGARFAAFPVASLDLPGCPTRAADSSSTNSVRAALPTPLPLRAASHSLRATSRPAPPTRRPSPSVPRSLGRARPAHLRKITSRSGCPVFDHAPCPSPERVRRMSGLGRVVFEYEGPHQFGAR